MVNVDIGKRRRSEKVKIAVSPCVQEAEQITSRQIQLMARNFNLAAHG